MKIKIDENYYNAEENKMMLVFSSDTEKIQFANQILRMPNGVLHYCQYNPEENSIEEVEAWMRDGEIQSLENIIESQKE